MAHARNGGGEASPGAPACTCAVWDGPHSKCKRAGAPKQRPKGPIFDDPALDGDSITLDLRRLYSP